MDTLIGWVVMFGLFAILTITAIQFWREAWAYYKDQSKKINDVLSGKKPYERKDFKDKD